MVIYIGLANHLYSTCRLMQFIIIPAAIINQLKVMTKYSSYLCFRPDYGE